MLPLLLGQLFISILTLAFSLSGMMYFLNGNEDKGFKCAGLALALFVVSLLTRNRPKSEGEQKGP